jgi:DNA-binding transcriptional LysR family regulator
MGQAENLRAFVAIVENESIGKAAEQAGIAKSAMSRKLRLLEEQLQTELITRTTRQWELTEAGRQYFDKSVQIIAAMDEAGASIRVEKRDLIGDIRVTVPLHFGKLVLAPLLLDFAELNPGLRLNVDFSDRAADLIGEHYNLAVRIGRLSDSSMIAKKLYETCHMYCASPEYLAKHAQVERPEDLKQHNILQFGHAHRFSWQFSPAAKSGSVKLSSVLNSDSGDFLISAAKRGHGIVRMPDFLAKPAIASGELTQILSQFAPVPLGVYIVYPASHHLPARVRALIDYLIGEIKNR